MTTSLWGRPSRFLLCGGWTVGLAVVLLGWWGTSGEATAEDQFRWTGLAVVGMLVCLAVSAGWVFTGMRAVGIRIRDVLPRPAAVARPAVEFVALRHAGANDVLVAAVGMRYYHRPACQLAQGKATFPVERDAHVREGRSACAVCRPDQPVRVCAT